MYVNMCVTDNILGCWGWLFASSYCSVALKLNTAFVTAFYLGPFKINGVPLRRVNRSYVIATFTGVNVMKFDDKYFTKKVEKKKKKVKGEFFEVEKEVLHYAVCKHLNDSLICRQLRFLCCHWLCRRRMRFHGRRRMTRNL